MQLLDDPQKAMNSWKSPLAENLTFVWPAFNLSHDFNANVDITLWGYWEDINAHEFIEVPTQRTFSAN